MPGDGHAERRAACRREDTPPFRATETLKRKRRAPFRELGAQVLATNVPARSAGRGAWGPLAAPIETQGSDGIGLGLAARPSHGVASQGNTALFTVSFAVGPAGKLDGFAAKGPPVSVQRSIASSTATTLS